jgi:predicted RNA binding protein YcfA (HicA-like mRNA interferase family)
MSFKKNLKKLFSEPVEMRIEEVENILVNFGYTRARVHGSHYIFTKLNCDTIILPVHKQITAGRYLDKIRKQINK